MTRTRTQKLFSAAILLGIAVMASAPVFAAARSYQKQQSGAQMDVDGGTLRIQFWSPEIVRVTFAPGIKLSELTSFSVVAKPSTVSLKRQESKDAFTLASTKVKVQIDKQTGAVSFWDPAGHMLLQEAAHSREIAPATVAEVSVTSATQSFDVAADEGIYGLGQHQQGAWNYNTNVGSSVKLAQANTNVGIPVMTSSKGYVLLWDNPAVTTISTEAPKEAASPGRLLRWSSEYGKAIDYYFCFGDGNIATAMAAYRTLTGQAPMMPRWQFGFWQSKERYASQEELLGVAEKIRSLKIPADGIIQDWQYWPEGNNTWGSHLFDPKRYPDPAAMFQKLHDQHFHTLISVWAKFDVGSKNSEELNAAGGMFPEITHYVFPPGQGQWYDPFSPAGREIYWKQIRTNLFAKGVDGWWLDAPEPEINNMGFRTYKTPAGPGYTVYNLYPLMHSGGIYQGQRSATDQKRVVILTRSAYAGQQRNSAITWSGDIQATWQVLRNQIPAGLNFSLSGIPYWNTDTGGFFGNKAAGNGDPSNPAYEELFARWFQFSSFCPMFRVHGSYGLKPGKELWRFDDKTQAIMRTYLDLRYRLLPYTYSVAWQVTSAGSTFLQPLVMNFPKDPKTLNIGNQYLFGPEIMVTPVTNAGATEQDVYLPATGAPWYNFWTGEKAEAGQNVHASAPLETLPLFVRPGAILPMGPFLQYSDEKPADPIELRVYRGADGKFTLYEDQGDSYNYEKGQFATIPITWRESTHTLEIGDRKGSFPGIVNDRDFHIVWVSDNHGAGVDLTEKYDSIVHYGGKSVKIAAH
ncbi:MAG TPA: TIM-barrel domain-containing protein [Bryobacteraceae bacterium]